MATYDNDLRLKEIATGDEAGTWGTSTNTNLELIAEAMGYGTQDCFATDADATTTVADGASDPARAMYFKVTSSATLTATRTLTIAPNTVSRVMLIENATTGSQSIAISQGSGGNVTIASGQTKMVYLDGAGSGAAVVDALADLELGTITVADLTATTADINGGTIDGVTIGGSSAGAGTFSGLTVENTDATITLSGTRGTGDTHTIATAGANSQNLNISADDSIFLRTSDTVQRIGIFSGGDISFYEDTGTTPKFFWDASAESLGIGTSSPSTFLDIDASQSVSYGATSNNDVYFEIANRTEANGQFSGMRFLTENASGVASWWNVGAISTASNYDTDLVFQQRTGAATYSEAMRIDSSGNLGLGVVPSAWGASYKALQFASGAIAGFSTTALDLYGNAYDSGTGAWKYLNSSQGATRYAAFDGQHQWFNAPSGTAGNAISFTQAMTLDASGNLGIGTSLPTAKLHILADTPVLMNNAAGTSEGKFDYVDSGATLRMHNFFGTGSNITFLTNPNSGAVTERMRIDSSGNVGLGLVPNTWSVGKALELGFEGNALWGNAADEVIVVQNAYYNSGWKYATTRPATHYSQYNGGHRWFTAASGTADAALSWTQAMTLDSSGNLLVGTTSSTVANPGVVLYPSGQQAIGHANGTVSGTAFSSFLYNNGVIGSISQNGTTAVLYNTSSDARLKENIADAEDAGAKVDAIQVRQFDWKADGSHQDYGMIAQELMTVAPEAVSGDPESDDMMGVDYSKLVPMLVKEIQSLRARVHALEGK